jgi:TRAP-type C4-dicarboxylate transport system permease small subunit
LNTSAQGRRSGAARAYENLHRLLGAIVALAIVFVAAGISLDVIARSFGSSPVPWMLEATEYCLFLATFLGAPWVLHLGEHVRIDMLVDKLPPTAARAVEIAMNVLGLAVSAILLRYSAAVALNARADGAQVIKELIFPEWWIFAVVVFSSALLCVEFAVRIANATRPAAPHADRAAGGF